MNEAVKTVKKYIIIAAMNCLYTGRMTENSTYFLEIMNTPIDVRDTKNEAAETPLYPITLIRKSVRIQIAAVQNIMKYRVIFTRPIALRKFVNGVEIEDRTVPKEKKTTETRAGSHF